MQTLGKEERLSSKKSINDLFTNGKSVYFDGIKIKIISNELSSVPVKVVVSVPKRIYKRAVDRNRIKRLIKEVYRKNKNVLVSTFTGFHLMFIFTSKTIPNYIEIEKMVVGVLKKANNKFQK
jgi:ribonuclease P protein component